MDCKTENIQRRICPLIFGAASSVMYVSHQNRMNPVIIIFSNEKSHQEIWFGRSHKGGTGPYFWECRLCHHAFSSGSHGRGCVVTWEELVQYGVPRKRGTERPEFVMSIHRMLLRVVQHEPVDLVFSLWSTELMRVLMLLRVLLVRSWALPKSLLCRECGNRHTTPWLWAGQLFSCACWERLTQALISSGASLGKTSESPGLPGKVQIVGMHIA